MRYIKKNNSKRIEKIKNWRVAVLKLFIIAVILITVLRLFDLQVIHRDMYDVLASGQHEIYQKLFPSRGRIFVKEKDGNGDDKFFPLAVNKEYALIYAQPKLIKEPDNAAREIYPLLFKEEIAEAKEEEEEVVGENPPSPPFRKGEKLDEDENFKILLSKLNKKDDPYESLKKKVDIETVDEINQFKITGIYDAKELRRYYPDNNIESHILGFVRYDEEKSIGQYGLEGYFDDILAGTSGHLYGEEGAKGNPIILGNVDFVEAKNGSDLYLTIDRAIQFKAYEYLQKAVGDYKIEEGTIIVMQPRTGAILAMVNYPDFDPNTYSKAGGNISVFNNQAILHTYEPGSIFKAVTMASALDLDKVAPDTKYNDEGFIKVDRFTIRNSDGMANGWQTMTQVLEKSLNTGAIFAAKQVGNEEFLNYVKKFGFGSKVGIELGGEALGDINSLENLNDVYTFTASFGQGITVTPIQMINAFAAIANDGKLMKPYLVDEIVDFEGKRTKTMPKQIRQVISPRAATLLKAMLVSVINEGHSKMAGVKGYHLAGKTGTAQVSDAGGGYSEDKFNHSFAGFGPIDDPQFVVLIKINNPKGEGIKFASQTTAPIFKKLAEFILKYYEIPPTRD
ncbi:MAG: penicillin-binding protein 2 [bacterium]